MNQRPDAEDASSTNAVATPAPAGGVRRFIELFAGCGFAVAQPLFEVFGQAPEQFAFRGATSRDIVLFAVIVVVVPPVALWVLEAVVGLVSRRAQQLVHLGLLGALAGAFAVQVLRRVDPVAVPLLVAALCAAGFVVLYRRFAAVRMWVGYAALAPIGFAGLFLLSSDTARLLSGTGTYDTSVAEPHPVVMLVLDELPLVTLLEEDGTIDEDLFPSFAALAEDSHWFRQTTSVSSTTMYAVPAMLSGVVPDEDRAAIAADHPDNLFTWLGEAFDLDVTESVTRLCPTSLCEPPDIGGGGLRSLLRDAATTMRTRVDPSATAGDITAGFVEPVAGVEGNDDAERLFADLSQNQPARFTAMLDHLGSIDPDVGSLSYAHVLMPHVPFRYTEDGTLYDEFAPELGRFLGVWDARHPELVELQHERHLQQARYTDALLGALVDRLHALDLYDDVTLVVAADHGIAFIPGESSRADFSGDRVPIEVASQLMYVPFFVKEAGQVDGVVDDRNTWTVDIVPTLADVLGAEIPWEVDGVSALGSPREDGPTSFYVNEFSRDGTKRGRLEEVDTRELWPEALRHTIDHAFPGGSLDDDPWRTWRIGPRPELVGRSTSDPALAGAPLLEPRFDPEVDLDLPAERGKVPALIRTFLDGIEPGDAVAVSVNGTVTATTTVSLDGSVTVLVNPTLFRTGANELRVHDLR